MISNILSSAVSGLNANAQRVGAAAQNIANTNTPGYQPVELQGVSLATGGTRVVSRPLDAPPMGSQINPEALSGTDIGKEFANMILAEHAYSASAKVLSAGDELSRSLLDELA